MASLKSYFASKRSVAVDQISSSSSEDASDSTRNETPAPSTRNETPAPSTRNETPAPSTSASACPLQCCILDSPTPNRLDVDKETSARLYGKKRVTSNLDGYRNTIGWFSAKLRIEHTVNLADTSCQQIYRQNRRTESTKKDERLPRTIE